MVSRILGFARTAVVTAIFGASGAADVINLTFAVPNNLRKLMAEGALSSAFIPVLSETLVEKPDGTESKSIVRSILTSSSFSSFPFGPVHRVRQTAHRSRPC
jgi:putative peptidoglycan lipid II flippase